MILDGVGFGQRGTVILAVGLDVPHITVELFGEEMGIDVEVGGGSTGGEDVGRAVPLDDVVGKHFGEDLKDSVILLLLKVKANLVSPSVLLVV